MIIAVIFLMLFFSVVEDLVTRDPLIEADLRIVSLVQIFRTRAFDQVMTFVTYLGNWPVVFAGVALVTALMILRQRRTEIVALLVSVLGGEALVWLTKSLFQRPRPEIVNALTSAGGPSFPSGHAFVAFSFYGLVAWFASISVKSRGAKVLIGASAVLWILTLGFSRIYLGVHWPSDVLASFALGAAWLVAIVTAFHVYSAHKAGRAPDPAPIRLWSATFVGLWILLAWSFYVAHPLVRVSPSTAQVVALSPDRFPEDMFARVPRFSEDIVGAPMEPLNVILVGSKMAVLAAFGEAGWQPADPVNARTVWRLLVAQMMDEPYPRAPGTPTFWLGKPNDMGFEKPTTAGTVRERHHLHLWTTHYIIEGAPVWVGTVHRDKAVYTSFGLVSPFHDIDPAIDKERQALRSDFVQATCVEKVTESQITGPMMGENALKSAFFTDGRAIVFYLGCQQ